MPVDGVDNDSGAGGGRGGSEGGGDNNNSNNNNDDERHRREEADRRAKRMASKQSKSVEQLEKERQRKLYRQEILKKHAASVGTGSTSATAAVADATRTASTSTSGSSKHRHHHRHQQPPPPSSSTGQPPKSHKKVIKDTAATTATTALGGGTSAFQALFGTRAQGFQVEFRFRNAPPRPPVGPCFVGETIDAVLYRYSKQYKPLNSVEVNHTWKLHTDNDIGVPLAPSAMDLRSYKLESSASKYSSSKPLHPDDDALLNWTGSLGDTAAEQLKRRQEQARVAARMIAAGRTLPVELGGGGVGGLNTNGMQTSGTGAIRKIHNPTTGGREPEQRKKFSRVLKEEMQTWMKKTTYLSNDYSRKVHDFKSLAKTKSDVVNELQRKQKEMSSRRTVKAIEESFAVFLTTPKNSNNKSSTNNKSNNNDVNPSNIQHPSNPKLKPVHVYPILPNVQNWGRSFTHVVIDKAPITLPSGQTPACLSNAFVTDVERKEATARMSCNVIAPAVQERIDLILKNNNANKNKDDADMVDVDDADLTTNADKTSTSDLYYESVQKYDLDVIPLKDDEYTPHSTFTLWMDGTSNPGIVTYIPISSRVSLTTGRPPTKNINLSLVRTLKRRPLTSDEQIKIEERMAEVDIDMAEKHNITRRGSNKRTLSSAQSGTNTIITATDNTKRRKGIVVDDNEDDDDDDGEDDFGDNDGDDDEDDDSDNDNVFGGGGRATIVAAEN